MNEVTTTADVASASSAVRQTTTTAGDLPSAVGELPAQAQSSSNAEAGTDGDDLQTDVGGGNFAVEFASSSVGDEDKGRDVAPSAAAAESQQMTSDKFSDSFLAIRGGDNNDVSFEDGVAVTQGDAVVASSSFELLSPSSDKDSISLPSPEAPPPPLPANLPLTDELSTEPPIPPPRPHTYANSGVEVPAVVPVSARPPIPAAHSSPVPTSTATVSLAADELLPVGKPTTSAVMVPSRHITTAASSGPKSRFTVQPTSSTAAAAQLPSVNNVQFPLSFPSDDATPPPLPPRRSFPPPQPPDVSFPPADMQKQRSFPPADVQKQQQQQHQLMRGTSLPAAAPPSAGGRIASVDDAPPPPPRRMLSRPVATGSQPVVDPFAPIPPVSSFPMSSVPVSSFPMSSFPVSSVPMSVPVSSVHVSSMHVSKQQAAATAPATSTLTSTFPPGSGSAVVETTIAPLPRPRPRHSQTAVVSSGDAAGPGTAGVATSASSGSSSPWQSVNTPPIVDPAVDPFSNVDPFASSASPDDPFAAEPSLDAILSDLGRDFDADTLSTTAFRTRAVTIGSASSSDVYEATSVHEAAGALSNEPPHSTGSAELTASPVVSRTLNAEPVGSSAGCLLVDLNTTDDNTDDGGGVRWQPFPADIASSSSNSNAATAASDFSQFGDLRDMWYSSGTVDWTASSAFDAVNSAAAAAAVNSDDVISSSDVFDLSVSGNNAVDKHVLDRHQAEEVSSGVGKLDTSLFAVEPAVSVSPHVVKSDALNTDALLAVHTCEPGLSVTSQVVSDSQNIISLASCDPGTSISSHVVTEPGVSVSPQVNHSAVPTCGPGVSVSRQVVTELPGASVDSQLLVTDSSDTSRHSWQSLNVTSNTAQDLDDVVSRSLRAVSEPPTLSAQAVSASPTLSVQAVSASVEHRLGND